MKTKKMLFIVSLTILVAIFVGCKKNSSMPVEAVETPPADTTPPAQTWEAPDTTAFSEVDLESELAEKIKENLQILYFEFDKFDLTTESLQKLQVASDFLKQQPSLRIRLDGHADEIGTTEYNMALGEKRAKAAYDVLTRYGINASRMETISFGREKLANPNCAMDPATKDACEALNRRVEYTIIKN